MTRTGFALLALASVFIAVESGYILTAPQVLLAGSEERICLTLTDITDNITISLMLVDRTQTVAEDYYLFPSGESGCVAFPVPQSLHDEDRHVNLWITGISPGYNFSSSTFVIVRNDPTVTFIQTDKPLYKPGETAKFRILTVGVDLKPVLDPITSLAIYNPNGIKVKQWTNVIGEEGLVSQELELSEEPLLGEWKISAELKFKTHTQTFKVEEYVLPKFEVVIKPPPFLRADATSVTAEVCAKYSHGQKVKGIMDVEVCIKSPHLSSIDRILDPPCDKVTEKIDGCRMFTLDSKLLNLGSAEFPFWDHRVNINASVKEFNTEMVQYGFSDSAKVIQEPLKLDFAKSNKYFKPGLPYKAKVRVKKPDGTPAVDEPIKVAAVDYESGVRAEDIFLSNAQGELLFVLPGELLLKSKEATLLAEAIRYKDSGDIDDDDRKIMYQPTALIQIKPWYSRSKSYIQIFPVEETVECGKELSVGLAYTTIPGAYLTFHYQVVSRGNIVKRGSKKQHYDLPYSPPVDEPGVLSIKNNLGPPPPWVNKGPLTPDQFFGEDVFGEAGAPGEDMPIGQQSLEDFFENLPDFPDDPFGENDPVNVKPDYSEPLLILPDPTTDPYAGREPVNEDLIKPDHFEPLGKLPDSAKDPYAGREPVNEDLIKPDHFEPVGYLPDSAKDPYAGREPVNEDLIKPDHFEPLGNFPDSAKDPYAGREPVNEEFIQPEHFEPLGNLPDPPPNPFAGREPVNEEFIQPEHFEPLGKIPFPDFNPDDFGDGDSFEEDFVQPDQKAPSQSEGKRRRRQTDNGIREGDRISIKEEKKKYQESTYVNHLQLSIPVTPEMAPEAQLVVYHVRGDGEVVADSVSFKVKRCFQNQVEFKFKKPRVRPGKKTTVRVKAEPGSLCGIHVVDKSVQVEGKNTPLSPEQVYRQLAKYEIRKLSRGSDDEYCHLKITGSPVPVSPVGPPGGEPDIGYGPPGLGPLRKKRRSPLQTETRFYSPYVDSIEAFQNVGLVTMTDLDLQTRPCELKDLAHNPAYRMKFDDWIKGIPGPAGPLSVHLAAAIADNTLDVDRDFIIGEIDENREILRSHFPETWLWDLMRIGDTGQGLLTRKIPDTITEWVGGAMCTNLRSGFGVSHEATVSTFQPFFISYALPYSAVRGERLPVKVNVFNYIKGCLEVKLNLKKSRRVSLDVGDYERTVCVCEGDPVSETYYIIPKGLGRVKIAVDSRSVKPSGVCSNSSNLSTKGIGARDRVVKKLMVKTEGDPREYTYSALVCPRYYPRGKFSKDIKLKLPPNVVPGSARAMFSISGDLMGAVITGLDNLVMLPRGCGEQNMLTLAPNVYILQYLEATGQLSPQVEQKIKGLMEMGYQKQLNYRHKDGSYSGFGKSDETGSIWLTAFVVKSFSQASRYIFIDPQRLQQSISWFQLRQLDSGCFPQVGPVLHKEMSGGLTQGSQAALTAYILIAMLEANTSISHPSVQGAVRCLEAASLNDTYSISLAAYALTLYDPTSIMRSMLMDKLHGTGKFETGSLHWEREKSPVKATSSNWRPPYKQAAPIDIEMTAYALLAYISADEPNNIMLARLIVRWLMNQKNSRGGFSSTQDTVVALQALALYGQKVYNEGTQLKCKLKGTRIKRQYNVTEENKLVLQSSRVRKVPNQMKVTLTGTGCASIQAYVRYNVRAEPSVKGAFDIKVSVFRSKSNMNDCKKRTLNICTRYSGEGYKSNAAIVQVNMVTGWEPIKDSIVPVTMVAGLGIKRFEIRDNDVNFYFEEMTSQRRCFEFEVYQGLKISAPRDATVKVFDYYETDQTVTTKYGIKTTCGTKEEIPYEVTDMDKDPLHQHRIIGGRPPLGQTEDPFFIQQRRVEPMLPPFLVQKLKAEREKEKQAQKADCPVCLTERPKDFPQKYCTAFHAYKAFTGRQGIYPVKLQSDFKPKQGKVPVEGFSNIALDPACQCETIFQQGRAMVLAPKGAYSKKLMRLTSLVTVIPTSKQIEREARILSTSCGS